MPRLVDHDQRRHEITDAAARVIARAGIQSATMREVAAEAGFTTGALTHYFADRHELLLATFQESLGRRRSTRPPTASTPAVIRLRSSLEGALPLDADRRRHWLVTLTCCTQAADDPGLARAQRDAYREFRDYISSLLIEAELTSADAARSIGEQLIAGVDGLAIQALFDPESFPRRSMIAGLDALLELHFGKMDWRLPVVSD